MVTSQRMLLTDAIRTNGATPNPWWSNAVVYQIYPRSFQDSNGDGMGDLKGITSRLDYLADLGVDVIWLSPVFTSPQDDNGYDISDYQDIDPLFGTLDDMDELLDQAHQRGLKVVMDLVVNHTSDEHAWFQASRDKNDPHADWYWWRPAREGFTPGEPGAEPNKWGSYFGGSAWEFDPQRGEYFFHQYSKKQPDLNWENPEVRQAVYAMMNWWMDRGIDGFRMDVITQVSKTIDAEGRLPGEEGSDIEDLPVGPDGFSSPFPFCSDGPRIDEYLSEMRQAVFAQREGFLTVGEAPGITAERNGHVTDPQNGELDMLFLFEHVDVDCENHTKWNPIDLRLGDLKRTLGDQQRAVAQAGWASLFFNNHDQPRSVSRWGDDSTEESRSRSAKALGLLMHMHRGTPYIYQGEELGMTNAHFTSLDQYRDLESLNMYRQRVEEAGIQTSESMMDALARRGRDNARTPMQWDGSQYAGFTEAGAQEPWISVNPNHVSINAAAEFDDPDSVYSFYKKLIELRHTNPVVAAGDWELVDEADDKVYAFTRSLGDERLLVMVNVSGQQVPVPAESAGLLGDASAESADRIVIGTYDAAHAEQSLKDLSLSPWEGVVVRL
ncbi:glycoside hydrolase family 13 protein [Alloscardovia criceti]|uniref:glycoside hydrolase family 13 protein n=1 Tax=Alloscardovia criceti TaxID=356828 RepID=UPI00037CD490|nr:alpha-glucosidase [Alloscardovia criceti]